MSKKLLVTLVALLGMGIGLGLSAQQVEISYTPKVGDVSEYEVTSKIFYDDSAIKPTVAAKTSFKQEVVAVEADGSVELKVSTAKMEMAYANSLKRTATKDVPATEFSMVVGPNGRIEASDEVYNWIPRELSVLSRRTGKNEAGSKLEIGGSWNGLKRFNLLGYGDVTLDCKTTVVKLGKLGENTSVELETVGIGKVNFSEISYRERTFISLENGEIMSSNIIVGGKSSRTTDNFEMEIEVVRTEHKFESAAFGRRFFAGFTGWIGSINLSSAAPVMSLAFLLIYVCLFWKTERKAIKVVSMSLTLLLAMGNFGWISQSHAVSYPWLDQMATRNMGVVANGSVVSAVQNQLLGQAAEIFGMGRFTIMKAVKEAGVIRRVEGMKISRVEYTSAGNVNYITKKGETIVRTPAYNTTRDYNKILANFDNRIAAKVVDTADGEKYLRTVETSVRTSRHNFKMYDYKYDVEKRLEHAEKLIEKGENSPEIARHISIASDKAALIAEFAIFTGEVARRAMPYAKRVDTAVAKSIAEDLKDMAKEMAKLADKSDEDSAKALIIYEKTFGDSTPMMLAAHTNPPVDPGFIRTRAYSKVAPPAYTQNQGKTGSAAIIGAVGGGTIIALTAAGAGAVALAATATKSGSGDSEGSGGGGTVVEPSDDDDDDDDDAGKFEGSWSGSSQLDIQGVPTQSGINVNISKNSGNYAIAVTVNAGGTFNKSSSGPDEISDAKILKVGGFRGQLNGSTMNATFSYDSVGDPPTVTGSADLN